MPKISGRVRFGLGCFLLATHLAAVRADEPWTELLSQGGLTRQSAQLDPGRWREGGAGSLALFDRLWDDWFEIRPFALEAARELLSTPGRILPRVRFADRCLSGDASAPPGTRPAADDPGADLAQVLAEIQRATIGGNEDAGALRAKTDAVPAEAATLAARLLRASLVAAQRRESALARVLKGEDAELLRQRLVDFALADTLWPEGEAFMREIDLRELLAGASALAADIDTALEHLPDATEANFRVEFDTAWGKVVIAGNGSDTHDAGRHLLILDMGGNDVYAGGAANNDIQNPVSVIIDLGGDDTYAADAGPAFAAAFFGYAFLIDVAGDDTYRVGGPGEGCAVCGVGVLSDHAGNDHYDADRFAQGAAALGAAVLEDRAGNDVYHAFQKTQGFAEHRGFAALVDVSGDDRYDADDTDIRYPSAQQSDHNTSLAQGAGFGRRGHYPGGDGLSVAGGIAFLIDGAGNDTYSAGVFGQGTAYWYAAGFLVDLAGDDSYHGVWYVQGSSAHYAVSGLLDLGGNDRYTATVASSQAFGHDFSVGLLYDESGNDEYRIASMIGGGHANGVGAFADLAGDDVYSGGVLGDARNARPDVSCLGLFLDGGGEDVFPQEDAVARPKSFWKRPGDHATSFALGIDR